MLLRPTEACILLLVFFKTGYSFKKQLCNNAYMPCAQGQGVCKPECMKGEERIGFCHGLSCSCCKTPRPGGGQDNYILALDEGTIYDEEDSWGRHTHGGSMKRGWGNDEGGGGGWSGSGRVGAGGGSRWGGGGRGVEGKSRGESGPVTDFREGVRCEFEGNFYADGAEWTMDCMAHKCIDGLVSSKLSNNCCEFEEKKYCDGDTWSRFCTVYSCWHGHVDSKDDEHCCVHEGKLYLNGDSWTEGCYDILCHMGRIQEKKIASCCEDNGVMYESGQTWTEVCDHFKCNNGMIERSDVNTCCSGPGGVMKPSGETWRDGCMDLTCHDGNIEEKIAPALCCEHEDDLKDNGATWQSECDMHICVNGLVNTVPLPHACCEDNGERKKNGDSWEFDSCHTAKCFMGNIVKELIEDLCCEIGTDIKQEGETWENGCIEYTCKKGKFIDGLIPGKCCTYEGSIKENNEQWITECDKFTCVNGEIQNEMSPSCCLVENTLKMVKDGDIWFEDCFRYQCVAPNINKVVNYNACCVDDPLVYEESATVLKNECEIHECKCTEAGCSLLMTDDSQCEKEDLKAETRENEPDKNKKANNKLLKNLSNYKKRPVPQMACRYNNTWMLHGTTLVEGCFKIMCEGGCTCYEMLQHGCCYNNDTEHKNEGEIWEANCTAYTCLDGEITMTNSTSPECSPKKRKGCMYGEMEYSNGDTIAYGCSIHQCEIGRFVSYPDPTCCVVDGYAYPSGSKWQDECFTYICDMGLIKKSDRGICKEDCTDSCQGSQVEDQIQLQQMQQPQPCQSCCMFGEITVQSGQTWMDKCNTHSCYQGTISTSAIANCK